MSHFYRLSINEVDAFEVIVVHPDTFVQRYATDSDFVNSTLNRAAHDALCQQWKAINRTEDPPPLPERFKIEPISGFDPSSIHPCLGPFHYITPIGTVSLYNERPLLARILTEKLLQLLEPFPADFFDLEVRAGLS